MKTLALTISLGCIGLVLPLPGLITDDKVIVHEWGTFTCLQDEQGRAIGGINVDDEPVPNFVWQYANRTVAAPYSQDDHNFGLPPYNADGGKGWTVGDPTVTMRLETPVIYLYPPKGRSAQPVPPLDVHVDFHGGVLSQYYPFAYTNGVQLNGDIPYQLKDGVTADMTTGLTWQAVRLGASGQVVPSPDKFMPEASWFHGQVVATENKVWTTPREVSAPLLQVKFSSHDLLQAEHFLFYRGVGHLESPLLLMRNDKDQMGDEFIELRQIIGNQNMPEKDQHNIHVWILQIRKDGACAFRDSITGVAMADFGIGTMGKISGEFADNDFSSANLTKLKSSMHDALVKEGLYDDEATAMLKTWDLSYFKSPGLRFFYIVPRAWVDKVLPLTVTGAPTDITRVMVGRIELITDAQKAALQRLSDGPCPDLQSVKKAAQVALQNSTLPKAESDLYYRGEKPLTGLGIAIPPLVQDYLSLGRFRDALVLQKFWQQKSMPLAQFINENGIAPEGVEIKGRDLVPLPPDVSLKTPRAPASTELHP